MSPIQHIILKALPYIVFKKLNETHLLSFEFCKLWFFQPHWSYDSGQWRTPHDHVFAINLAVYYGLLVHDLDLKSGTLTRFATMCLNISHIVKCINWKWKSNWCYEFNSHWRQFFFILKLFKNHDVNFVQKYQKFVLKTKILFGRRNFIKCHWTFIDSLCFQISVYSDLLIAVTLKKDFWLPAKILFNTLYLKVLHGPHSEKYCGNSR